VKQEILEQEMSEIFFSSQIDWTAFAETASEQSKVQSKQTPEHNPTKQTDR